MKLFLPLIFLLTLFYFPALAQYPQDVEAVLQKAGKNRPELEKTINHFKQPEDSLKLKATYFLIANMDIHYSADYYWADSAGRRIDYNELDYPDFATAVKAFEEIKQKHRRVKPIPITYRDIDTIKADFLIDNVNQAFESWEKGKFTKEEFDDFCEYLLPYRASIEPLQTWRSTYKEKFKNDFALVKEADDGKQLWQFATNLENTSFTNSFSFENRKEPLPRLGAMQLLQRRKGPCEDIADFKVFALRSQGVAACVDAIPYWATSSGGHFLTNAFTSQLQSVSLEVLKDDVPKNQMLAREPGKVLRTTYAKQQGTLASITDTAGIPDGFMRQQNYIDVTADYWKTQSITCNIPEPKAPIVYACVFNYSKWRPIWWSKITHQTANFSDMPQGAVFLPAYYLNGKIEPAGYPIAAVNNTQKKLKPNLQQRRSISLPWQQDYLVYQTGSKYKLYYWDNAWKLLQQQVATNTEKMVFDNVPANALLLLRPEYSKGKERPFIVDENGQRTWW
ncbi:MAG TPA: hypothetical protein VL125_17130 [Pelobium sp.]|nr:hypothetical protein [Pelobium sp.]